MTTPRRRRGLPSRAALMALCAGSALGIAVTQSAAGPRGERVVRGRAEVNRDGTETIIRTGRRSIIRWDNFDIASGETVRFVMPNGRSRVLNRIDGADPTRIDGTLLANGRVYIVNPAGVMFGAGSVVNVGALYAAAGQITDDNFMNGVNHFTGVTGEVIAQGMITADQAVLVGERVANHGTIIADNGMVAMSAGNDVMIGERDGNIWVKIDGQQANPRQRPEPVDPLNAPASSEVAAVTNTGTIRARRGTISLSAGDSFSLAIHNSGTIDAAGGSVVAKARGGTVLNSGDITASVDEGRAGSVTLQGQRVVNQGNVTADAQSGQAGRVELTSSDITVLADGSVVSAAGGDGKARGGEVLIHSYHGDTIVTDGAIVDISGGAAGGDGGFAEVSAKGSLGLHGEIKGDAAEGYKAGTVLFDPTDIVISDGGSTNDPEVNADGTVNEIDGAGTFFISTSAIEAFAGTVRLEATQDIFIFDDINKLNGGFVLDAGRDLIFGVTPDPESGFTLNLSISANFLDFTAGRNFTDNTLEGTKLFATQGDIRLTAVTGHTDFAQASVPNGQTFYLTQAESMFFGAGPFGLVANPEHTNVVLRVTNGFLILGGDFGGVTGFQDILSLDARSTDYLRVEDDLNIRTVADLRSEDDVQILGYIHSRDSLNIHGGTDGTGAVLFQEAGLDFWGDDIAIRAGNNSGLGLAYADLITNEPLFRSGSGGATRPGSFTYQQDRAIASLDIPTLDQFAAGIGGMRYRLESNDMSVVVAQGAKVNGTELTLASQTGSFIDDHLNLISLDVFGDAFLNANVQSSGNQIYHDRAFIQGERLLTANNVHFQGTVDGTSEGDDDLALAADVIFDGAVGDDVALGNLNVERTSRINGQRITTTLDQRFGGAVFLGDDTALTALGDGVIRFGSTLDSVGSARDLDVQTDEGGLIIFNGDVGRTLALRDISLRTDDGDGSRPIPNRATIVGERSFQIFAHDFRMHQHEKFTTLGNLKMTLTGDAVLGDMVTIGNMAISADTITLLRRQAHTLLDGEGNLINDRGLDLVAGGQMTLSGILLMGGDGSAPDPTISDANGAVSFFDGTGFEVTRTPGSFVTLDALLFNGTVLDQRTIINDGPNPGPNPNPGESDELAASRPRNPIFRDSVQPEVYDLDLLAQLGIQARGVKTKESRDGLAGNYVYNDIGDDVDDPGQTFSATRIDIQTVIALLKKYEGVFGPMGQGSEVAAQAIASSSSNYLSMSQAAEVDVSGYNTYLHNTPSEALALATVTQLKSALAELQKLPLTADEFDAIRTTLLGRIAGASQITPEQLQKLIEAEPANVSSAPASATNGTVSMARPRDAKGRFVKGGSAS